DTVHYRWNESSFIYIPLKTGWSQAHFFQFKNDKYENLKYNRSVREFQYDTTYKTLTCITGWPYIPLYSIDNILQDQNTCNSFDPKINIAILDSLTLQPWTTDTCVYHPYNGSMIYQCGFGGNCIGHPQEFKYYQFQVNDPNQMNALAYFLQSTVPAGDYILAFTYNTAAYSTTTNWPAVRNQLSLLGSNMINTLTDNRAFIFFVKKG